MGPEHKYNMVLLGPVGVGKSALTVKYITKRFIMDYDPFIEGTYSKVDVVDNHEVLVKVRDTYLENFSDVGKYLKWADGYLVVYSVTSSDSFEQMRCLLEALRRHLRARPVDCPVVLVGNKCDLERCRQVSSTAGATLASQFGCSAFCETSASEEFASVETAMHTLIREVQRERDGGAAGGGIGCIPGSVDAAASSNVELPALFIGDELKSMSLPVGSVAPKAGGGSSSSGHVRRTKTAKLSGTATGAAGGALPGDEQKRRANGGGEGRKWPGSGGGGSSGGLLNGGGAGGGGGFRLFNKSFKIFS